MTVATEADAGADELVLEPPSAVPSVTASQAAATIKVDEATAQGVQGARRVVPKSTAVKVGLALGEDALSPVAKGEEDLDVARGQRANRADRDSRSVEVH